MTENVLYVMPVNPDTAEAGNRLSLHQLKATELMIKQARADNHIVRLRTSEWRLLSGPVRSFFHGVVCRLRHHRFVDIQATSSGRVLQGCDRCHREFQIVTPLPRHFNCRSAFVPMFADEEV